MAPTIFALRDLLASPADSRDVPDEPAKTWMIVALTLGIVLVVSIVVFISITVLRRRQYRQAKAENPYLSRQEFRRRSRMNELDRQWDDEQQRRAIIRKSLATRGSESSMASRAREDSLASQAMTSFPALSIITTTGGTIAAPETTESPAAIELSSTTMSTTATTRKASTRTAYTRTASTRRRPRTASDPDPNSADTEYDSDDDGESSPTVPPKNHQHQPRGRRVSLKEDWKEYEASIHRARSKSRDVHPAAAATTTTTTTTTTDLAVPARTLSQHSLSHSRSSHSLSRSRSRSASQASILNNLDLPPLPTIVSSPVEDQDFDDRKLLPERRFDEDEQQEPEAAAMRLHQRIPSIKIQNA